MMKFFVMKYLREVKNFRMKDLKFLNRKLISNSKSNKIYLFLNNNFNLFLYKNLLIFSISLYDFVDIKDTVADKWRYG